MADTNKQNESTNPFSSFEAFLNGGSTFATPAVTRAQALAVGQAFIAVLIVFGFSPSEDVTKIILGLSAALGVSVPVSDAAIRRGRANNAVSIAIAKQVEANPTSTDTLKAAAATLSAGQPELEKRVRALEQAWAKLRTSGDGSDEPPTPAGSPPQPPDTGG